MSADSVAAIVAAIAAVAASVAAIASIPIAARAANAAHRQTEQQRRVAEAASQPYVWADIRTDTAQGWFLLFIVGNSGPTIATNVTVAVDPPLPLASPDRELTSRAFDRLRDGIAAIAPGRTLEWTLGASPDLVGSDVAQPFTVTIDGCGPHGELPTLSYVVDLADFREANDSPPGSLHQLTQTVRDVAEALNSRGQ